MIKKTLCLTLAISLTSSIVHARSQVKAVGSSTVYPFVTGAAENFGDNYSYKTPIVESTGTGGGFKLFCAGIGEKTPDLSNASRQIKDKERKLCAKNGVTDVAEIKIGYDGIVLANHKSAPSYKFTTQQIYLGLAEYVPQNGKIVKNPYKKWSDINKKLPNKDIVVYGPPTTSGTRDAFVELVLQKSCMKSEEFLTKYPNKKTRKKYCSAIREDGAYIEAGENDNLIINKLSANKNALGVFGYSFLDNNTDNIKGSKVNGYNPSFKNISSGKYPISRSLFVYVKTQHYGAVKSLKPFVSELVSDDAIGSEGYLTDRGLIPLSKKELKLVQKNIIK